MKLAPWILLAALALPPAGASAADGTYDASFDVTLAYAHVLASGFGDTVDERFDARATGRIEGVVVRDGRLVDPGRADAATVAGASGAVVPAFDARPTGDGCTVRGARADGPPQLRPAGAANAVQSELLFTPMDELDVDLRCVYGGTSDRETRHLATIVPDGAWRVGGPAVARVAAPGGARAERSVDVTVSGADCPYAGDDTATCTLTMRGTLTFTRTGDPPAARRPMRLPEPGGAGARNGSDNLFVFNVVRSRVEGVVTARRSGTRDGQPTRGELEARTVWQTRASGGATRGNYAFTGTGPRWGRLATKAADHVWTGSASYDDGWREAPDAAGDERRPLWHDHGRCAIRWRARGGVSGSFDRGRRGVRLRLTLPNLPHRATGCRSGFDGDAFGNFATLSPIAVEIPVEAVRRATVTIPFARTWKRGATTLTYRGFLVLRRVTSCRTPPEYPCHTRFAASG